MAFRAIRPSTEAAPQVSLTRRVVGGLAFAAREPGEAVAVGRLRAAAAGWTPDLALFCVLLVFTATFGKGFSKLGLPGGTIYVTEIGFVAIVALSLRRVGVSGALDRMRRSVPFIPLGILWVAGAVAAARGLVTYGPHAVVHDVGLVEYSLVIPIVAVLVDTRARADLLARTLFVAGLGAAVTFAAGFFLLRGSSLDPGRLVLSAVTLYLSFVVLFPLARVLFAVPVRRLGLASACIACVLIVLTVVRGALVALVMAAVALILLAPRRRRAFAVLGVTIVVSAGAAVALQAFGAGWKPVLRTAPATSAGPSFVSADDVAPLSGGRVVTGTAEAGRYSREVPKGQWIQVTVTGLTRGARYGVSFYVEPETPTASAGYVGDTSGAGWGAKRWVIGPRVRWNRVSDVLTATAPSERLALWFAAGAAKFRLDTLSFGSLEGGHIVAAAASGATPLDNPNDAPTLNSGSGIPIWDDVRNVFSNARGDSSGANSHWRLDYWRFLIEKTMKEPALGVGFGKPADFRWRGVLYDARRGIATDPNDITPPHNSFLNVFYRMGLLGLVPLLVLVALALRRGLVRIRNPGTSARDRALLAGFIGAFVFATFIALFNVALENPYIGLFFWTPLAALLVLPRLRPRSGSASATDGH